MGLGDFFSTVVLKYKVEAEQAKKEIASLSGTQKKAAKENAQALQEQGKAAGSMAEQYAKGAAAIAAAYVIVKQGLEDFKKESALSIGSATVNIKRLDEAAGGLKTRWELMTVAQAGSQGAWKLSTEQIAFVVEGMRALEKKGYDGIEVQNALTESLKKGKLEGLDKFGIATKDLGSSAANLRSLMHQLGQATRDVGRDFDKAGDQATRAGVKFQNLRDKVGTNIGKGADMFLNDVEQQANAAGALAGGRFGEAYDLFRGYSGTVDTGALANKAMADAARLNTRQRKDAMDRYRDEQAKRKADMQEFLGEQAREAKTRAAEAKSRIAGIKKDQKDEDAALLDLAGLSLGGDGPSYDRDQANAAAQSGRDRSERDKRRGALTSVRALQEEDALRRSADKAQAARANAASDANKKSYLESMFGPVDEFDAYADGFRTLTDAVKASGDAILDSVIKGEAITKKSVGRAVASVLGAESHKLLGLGISTELQGIATLNPVMAAAGAAEIAGSFAIAAIASKFGGGGASSSTGGRASRGASQDHRNDRSGGSWTSGYGDRVVVLDGYGINDSPEYKRRQFRDSMRAAGSYAPPQGAGRA